MKKKYKVTTLLVFSICFFTAMLLADVVFTMQYGKKSLAATVQEDQNYQEEVLFSSLKGVEKITESEQNVVNSTDYLKNTELTEDNETNASELAKNLKKEVQSEESLTSADAISEDLTIEDLQEEVSLLSLPSTEAVITFDKVIPKVSESLNIRNKADAKAEVVGKLYKNSYATIIERGDEWTKITSGDVTGYVSNEYLYFDQDAINEANDLAAFKVKITAGTVNIRKNPGTEGEVLGEANKDDTFVHIEDSDTAEWIAIQYGKNNDIAYVTSEYAKEFIDLDTAVSKEEEEEKQKELELAKALAEAKKSQPQTTNRAAIKASDEEIFLLATVVAMEALGESYEGKLAVANVVVNRMLDGSWGNSISDVVYAPGQFSGASSGRVQQYASKVTESCKKAAVEALAGNNNIGSYKYFIMKSRANTSSYSKYYILGSHCFYAR